MHCFLLYYYHRRHWAPTPSGRFSALHFLCHLPSIPLFYERIRFALQRRSILAAAIGACSVLGHYYAIQEEEAQNPAAPFRWTRLDVE